MAVYCIVCAYSNADADGTGGQSICMARTGWGLKREQDSPRVMYATVQTVLDGRG